MSDLLDAILGLFELSLEPLALGYVGGRLLLGALHLALVLAHALLQLVVGVADRLHLDMLVVERVEELFVPLLERAQLLRPLLLFALLVVELHLELLDARLELVRESLQLALHHLVGLVEASECVAQLLLARLLLRLELGAQIVCAPLILVLLEQAGIQRSQLFVHALQLELGLVQLVRHAHRVRLELFALAKSSIQRRLHLDHLLLHLVMLGVQGLARLLDLVHNSINFD